MSDDTTSAPPLGEDELGDPVTPERLERLRMRFMFQSDPWSREIGLILDVLLVEIERLTALARSAEQENRMQIPTGVNPESKTWPWVLAFAIEMERKLAQNVGKDNHHRDCESDHDGACEAGSGDPGWLFGFDPLDCMARLYEETNELRAAVVKNDFRKNDDAARQEVTDESADVGNFSMMQASIAGNLKPYVIEPGKDDRDFWKGRTFTVEREGAEHRRAMQTEINALRAQLAAAEATP